MWQKLLTVKDVSFKYFNQSTYALQGVSFHVNKGEWLAIVGHNGSGKSTLARILNGLLIPEQGEVEVDGISLNEDTIWEIRKRIGMVFQNPDNQFVGTTVKDDVAFGLENNGVVQEVMIERVNEAIKQVKMEEFLDQEPHHLSGGQKQRVAIAGILAVKPEIIILDEATSMLDPSGREEVLQIVRTLKNEGIITVISITHDLDEAAKADRMIVMKSGSIMMEGTPAEIFEMDDKLIEVGLDIPFPIKLSKQLRKAGIPLKQNHLTEEGLVHELWTLKQLI
jgi:energy-coupling factor transport system ATP-binding protein